jgi:hypothetical protein
LKSAYRRSSYHFASVRACFSKVISPRSRPRCDGTRGRGEAILTTKPQSLRLKSTETKALKRSGMRWMSIRTIWSLRTGRSTTYFAK